VQAIIQLLHLGTDARRILLGRRRGGESLQVLLYSLDPTDMRSDLKGAEISMPIKLRERKCLPSPCSAATQKRSPGAQRLRACTRREGCTQLMTQRARIHQEIQQSLSQVFSASVPLLNIAVTRTLPGNHRRVAWAAEPSPEQGQE
jgi:hypothetical protein